MPARRGRLSTGVGRWNQVTIRIASLMAGSMRRVGTLLDHTGVQYSAVEWIRARVAIRKVVASAPQPEPASRSATRDLNFCEVTRGVGEYASDLSNVTPRYLGSEQKGRNLLLWLIVSSHLASLLLSWKSADTVYVVLSFSFQVWRYSPTVAMSLLSTPSTTCQSPSTCMIARSSANTYFWRR